MQHRRPDYVGIDTEKLTFRKRPAPQGREETARERVERELSNLMEDRRYWDGDPDYRAHVRHQFQRVYDSPDNPPQGKRIGPPELHATTVEPFKPSRETSKTPSSARNLGPARNGASVQTATHGRSLLSTPASSANRAGSDAGRNAAKSGGPALPGGEQAGNQAEQRHTLLRQFTRSRTRQAGNRADDKGVELFDPTDNDLDAMEREALRRQALGNAKLTLAAFDAAGYDTAAGLLRHYLAGSGEPLTVPATVVDDYHGVQEAEEQVVSYYREWLEGRLSDSNFGTPTRSMRDGDKIVVGGTAFDPPRSLERRVLWERRFEGAGDDDRESELLSEAQLSIGGGHVQGLGYIVLERRGDRIHVSGFIDFRVRDVYDFAKGQVAGFDLLESDGPARPFEVFTTTWRKRIDATIPLMNGQPGSFDLNLQP